ncbi:hypothetical protein CKAH01_09339 [Colletotrichum kahawae]|uniref:Uncharacterized protein n=1 Tax=Colletotrichum kahawae TaxID=34407 RepID=A0AAD9Y0W2_COLKA|nr:hypothetical protein CKAH01_09339 [Colletotrichum kahawae]
MGRATAYQSPKLRELTNSTVSVGKGWMLSHSGGMGARWRGWALQTIRVLGATRHPMRSWTCNKRNFISSTLTGSRELNVKSPVDYEVPTFEESCPSDKF